MGIFTIIGMKKGFQSRFVPKKSAKLLYEQDFGLIKMDFGVRFYAS